MRDAEPLCAKTFGLKDIARSRRGRGTNLSRKLIMYYRINNVLQCSRQRLMKGRRPVLFFAITFFGDNLKLKLN